MASGEQCRGDLFGAYIQDEYRLGEHSTLNVGGRFDGVRAYVHENGLGPRLGVTWQPGPNLTLHAGYARVFSPPLLENIPRREFVQHVNTTNAPDTLTDDPARCKRSHVFDLGAAGVILLGLTVGWDAYYKSVRNMQNEEQLGESLIFTPFTYSRGYKEGVELTTDYRKGAWLLYRNLALAATKGHHINSAQGLFGDVELRYISYHDIHADYDQLLTISAGAMYRWKAFTLHSDLLGGSGFYGGSANSEKLPAHATLNVGVVFVLAPINHATLALRFDVVNLFDESYLLHDAGLGATVNQYGERREVFGGVRCSF